MTEALLGELRVRFRETTASRLQEMRELLDALERDLADSVALQKLARHFHALAGLGATYGYPRVSVLGDEGEGAILPMTRSGATPPAALLVRWRELAAAVADAVAEEMPPAVVPSDVKAAQKSFDVLIAGKEQPAPRILAVEDDATQILLLRRVLAGAGYEVAVCSDSASFEQCLLDFRPDLLLMDVHLADPEMSGYDLLRSVRRSECFAGLPVIFVTSDSERQAITESAASGGAMVVTKPVDWRLLLAQVASSLHRASREREPES
jgi:CheY-like chemotaxis protein